MTLNQMIYFQTIAKHEHFRLAATELNLSQPSLSRSIATLEDELGVILFERKGRNVALTKSGKRGNRIPFKKNAGSWSRYSEDRCDATE